MSKKPEDNESTPGEISIDSTSNGELNTENLEKAFSSKNSAKASASSDEKTSSQNEDYEKLKTEYLYLRAEFDNFRKNSIKERSELVKYGAERFIRQLLSVIDNFDRALSLEVNAENYRDFLQGIELTSNEFKNQLANMGVRIDDPIGKAFDPNFHEALSSEESSDVEPGYITKVFQKAYWLHDKIIRPAQVIVAKAPTKASSEKNTNDQNENKENQTENE